MNINQAAVRENIARKLREIGISQKEAAERGHISQATLVSWMKGRSKPSHFALFWFAKGLGCEIDELLYPPGAKEPEKLDGLTIEQWRLRALRAEEARRAAREEGGPV